MDEEHQLTVLRLLERALASYLEGMRGTYRHDEGAGRLLRLITSTERYLNSLGPISDDWDGAAWREWQTLEVIFADSTDGHPELVAESQVYDAAARLKMLADQQVAHLSITPTMDLSFVPLRLRSAARLTASGREAMWPKGFAAEVVEHLAVKGLRVLGLDHRSDGDGMVREGLATEVPWVSSTTRDIEAAKRQALHGLERGNRDPSLRDYGWVLVVW